MRSFTAEQCGQTEKQNKTAFCSLYQINVTYFLIKFLIICELMDCEVFLRIYKSAALNWGNPVKAVFPEIQMYPFSMSIHIYAAE